MPIYEVKFTQTHEYRVYVSADTEEQAKSAESYGIATTNHVACDCYWDDTDIGHTWEDDDEDAPEPDYDV